MIEDKLSQDQRIRLECLAQANATMPGANERQVVQRSRYFETYVRGPGYTVTEVPDDVTVEDQLSKHTENIVGCLMHKPVPHRDGKEIWRTGQGKNRRKTSRRRGTDQKKALGGVEV